MMLKYEPLIDEACGFPALKIVDIPEWEAVSCSNIVQYAILNGFNDIVKPIKNNNGKYYEKKDGKIYIYLDLNIDGKYKIKNVQNAEKAAEITARFHNAAEGFSREGTKVNVLWGKRIGKLKKMTSCIERYCDYLIDKEKHNEFEKTTEFYIDDFLHRSKMVIRLLTSDGSIRRLEESMSELEICINNISSNTFGICDGRVIIQDIYHIGYNMVEEDIALIIKKVIENGGEKQSFDDIIKSYKSVRRLNSDSIDIIKALASYPVNSAKVIEQYMREKIDDEELTEKFRKYAKRETRTNILEV